MDSEPEINFINERIKFELKRKAVIKKWIIESITKEKQIPGTICYIFCSDEKLLAINKEYLKHNYYTDIITFDYTEPLKGEKKLISGDLFISVDRVKENAKDLGTSFDNELKRVMIHGVLHLVGYGDKTPAKKKMMRKKEDLYLSNIK